MKIIVWAHNSHVGDATATPMGGMDFQRNEPLVATWWEHVMQLKCHIHC
jgi:erythromycin esterase-like protein